MKLVKFTAVFVLVALLFSFCAGTKKMQKSESGTISSILREAKCPLTADQEKRLKEFKLGGGREAFRGIYDVFEDNQLEALKAVFGSSPGRDGGPEMPRFLFFAVIFENENCPFSPEQLEKMKSLSGGREAFQQMREIFTEKQSEVLQSMFNR